MTSMQGIVPAPMRLYHGSVVAIAHPDVTRNTGFADLGQGFYLTDDHTAAQGRARTRARRTGAPQGVVSVFELDEAQLPWAVWGADAPELPANTHDSPFGLRFDATPQGIAAWASYIVACRKGNVAVPGLGEPAIVRAWIATEEVEMLYAGFATPEDLAELLDPHDLVVQYCLRNQALLDCALAFVGTELVG